jgi:CRP-like cAMP-binding protein
MKEIKTLKRGQVLANALEYGPVWSVSKGMFRLDRWIKGELCLVQLALPGDLIGIETLCAEPYTYSVTAILPSEVKQQPVNGEVSNFAFIAKAFLQQQQRTQDMVKLRSGHVSDRLAYFLKLIDGKASNTDRQLVRSDLPMFKDLAVIVDCTNETVCRQMNAFMPARIYERPKSKAYTASPLLSLVA